MPYGFWAEYRKHPHWTASLVLLLVIGLTLDFTLISEPHPTSPNPGVRRKPDGFGSSAVPFRPSRDLLTRRTVKKHLETLVLAAIFVTFACGLYEAGYILIHGHFAPWSPLPHGN